MSSSKHEKSFVDFDKPYEQNLIGLKGIVYFGIGLFVLIVITFALMLAFQGVLEDYAKETKSSSNPMAMNDRESLPPEPRLQAAPGFSIQSDSGPINLELREPQAEYRELRKQWEAIWKEGRKDKATGTVIALPVDQAKAMLREKKLKARSGPAAENALKEAGMIITDASSGRKATLKRR